MRHICSFLFILFIQSYNLFSQNWEWATSSGTANADITIDHYTDLHGYSYLACVQSGGITVKKVDPSGSLLWTASAGLGSPAGITVNKNGYVFITGFFSGSTNIGGTVLTDLSGGQEGFIAALDEDGNWQWAVQFGSSTGDDYGSAIDIDHNTNDLVLTGAFEDSAYFDTVGIFAMWDQDMFIARYSENGSCIWVNTAGDFGPQEGIDVKTDQLGYSYVTGEYIDDIVFGPDVLPFSGPGGKDVFIAKADPFGNFIWGNRVHGTNNNIWSHALALDPAFGGCYVHGRYSGSTTFPNGVNYPDPMGIFPFITKVDSIGNGIWNFRYGFGSDPGAIPTPSDISIVGDSIFYSGSFYSQGTCDIDGFNLSSNGWYDLYIGVMDQGQNTSRVIQLTDGSGSSDGGGFLSSDLTGALIVSGTFNANSSIGSLPIPNIGVQDNFIAKEGCVFKAELSSSGLNFCQGDSVLLVASPVGAYNYQWYVDGAQISVNNDSLYFSISKPVQVVVSDSTCSSLSPAIILNSLPVDSVVLLDSICPGESVLFEGNVYNQPGTYYVNYQNNSGCDSIMVLDLSLVSPDTSVIQSGDSLIASASGAQLQWLDCDELFIPVAGATSTIFIPDSSGNYALQVSENGCTDTSSCYNVVLVGQVEYIHGYKFSLYPSPARDNIHIEVQRAFIDQPYYILDHCGRVLSSGRFDEGVNSMDIRFLAPGMYQFLCGKGLSVRFIVIE